MVNEVMPVDNLTAKKLWDFHLTQSLAVVYDTQKGVTRHNQSKNFTGVTIPFCVEDWESLSKNNRFIAPDGGIGEILTLEWDVYNEKATINYKINYLYTNNLQITTNEGE